MPGLPAEDPQQLASQLKRGDPAALERAIRTLGPRVAVGLKRRHPTLSAEDIEDVLSTASLRLWQSRAQYDPAKGSLASWYFIIADNAAKDVLRKARRRGEQPMSLERLAGREARHVVADEGAPTPGMPELTRLVLQLPEVDQRIITGYADADGEGPWAATLGRELGMQPGAVRVRCLRIKERLRRELPHATSP
jgi:RNA polymerase sigma-70 factor (ECF subfamily)